MKSFAILLALAVSSVSAQAASANAAVGVDVSVTAEANAVANAAAAPVPPPVAPTSALPSGCTYTSTAPGTSTITAVITSTYCPVCDEAKTNGEVYTTTYETVYAAVCPTGITSVAYVVTQICTGTTPIDTATLPPGFVATTAVCTACPGAPTITVTQPATGIVIGAPTLKPATTGTPGGPVQSVTPFLGGASSLSSGLLTVGAGVGSVFMAMLLL